MTRSLRGPAKAQHLVISSLILPLCGLHVNDEKVKVALRPHPPVQGLVLRRVDR